MSDTVAPWKLGLLGGLASYIDAATIVAVAVVLPIWQARYGLSPLEVGAASAGLALAIGIGSIVGGRLGDRVGRKRIYTADLLVYAASLVLVVFAANPAMLLAGVVVAGLAVGADVPTSLALVGELAPTGKRGRLIAATQLLWTMGPVVVTLLAALFGGPLGADLPALLFGHLFVVALVAWVLRHGLAESGVWAAARGRAEGRASTRGLWSPPVLRALAFTTTFYLLLCLAATFAGSFGTYLLVSVGGLTIDGAATVALVGVPFALAAVVTVMRLLDTAARRPMFYLGSVLSVGAWLLPIAADGAVWSLVAAILVYTVGAVFAGEPHYKLWSQELFPTLVRGASQGISFGVARLVSSVFLLFVPTLLALDFVVVLWLVTGFTAAYAVLGALFMPRRQNRSIGEIDAELGARPAGNALQRHSTEIGQETGQRIPY